MEIFEFSAASLLALDIFERWARSIRFFREMKKPLAGTLKAFLITINNRLNLCFNEPLAVLFRAFPFDKAFVL